MPDVENNDEALAGITDFQRRTVARINDILDSHAIEPPDYAVQPDGWLSGTFQLRGKRYRVEIYENEVVMTSGRWHLYELIHPDEARSDTEKIDSFCHRLRRLIEENEWFAADELSALSRWWRQLKSRRSSGE